MTSLGASMVGMSGSPKDGGCQCRATTWTGCCQHFTAPLPSLPHTTEPGGVRGAIARENGRATLRSLPLVGIGDDVDGQAAHCIFNPLVSVFCPLSGHRSPANANRRSVLSCPAPKKERSQVCPPCHRRLSTSTTVRAAGTSVTSDRQQGIASS